MDEMRVDYTTFISLAQSKNLPIQYTEDSSSPTGLYWLVLADGSINWSTYIQKGSPWAIDFETNYKSTANGPVVQSVSSASTLGQEFGRIYNEQFKNNEEVRLDTPLSFPNNFAYAGVAPTGSDITDTIWSVIRISYDANGRKNRIQFRQNVAWSDRANGW